MPYFYGNPRMRKATLPDAVTPVRVEFAGGTRGFVLHSRNNLSFRLAFQSGGVAEAGSETYMLITAGNYADFESQRAIDEIFLMSENAGGDVVEIATFDTVQGLAGGYTP